MPMPCLRSLFAVCAALVLGFSLPAGAASTQYDFGDPSADEWYVLEIINRARANPTAEGTRLGIDIKEGLQNPELVQVRPPLAMNKILLQIARTHSQDMYTNAFFSHTNSAGKDPFQRMADAGYTYTTAGENIATGTSLTAAGLEDLLMVDSGVSGRGHRVNLLDIKSSVFREIGIGYHAGSTANAQGYKNFITQDFGSSSAGPFLVGAIYDDKNSNGFYDIGEGLSGVTVSPDSGTYFAVTNASGGYCFPVASSGSLTLTISGGALSGTITKTVTLSSQNAKLDGKLSEASGGSTGGTTGGTGGTTGGTGGTTGGTGGTTGGTSGGTGGTTGGTTYVSATNTDSDTDGFPDEVENFMGTSSSSSASTPFGGSAANAKTLDVLKMAIKLNFGKSLSDSVQISGTLPIPANFIALNQQVVADVGGVLQSFFLNEKGSSPTGKGITNIFKLRIKSKKGVVAEQLGKYTLKLSKGDFAGILADEGLVSQDLSAIPVSVPVIVIFNTQMFQVTPSQMYYAKAGKTGRTK